MQIGGFIPRITQTLASLIYLAGFRPGFFFTMIYSGDLRLLPAGMTGSQ
ncbi:hypothetical protein SAMN07250955_10971 [Arboricoccus pini]|uniref:Uncharacterized protein n=1 Tax=Arboricoccus pini TaxID=1963835 RepID=A0A212RIQ6_9PROT|nr:hypothetical protein SAMN07250955_10971 [Arboricoccus pini]